MNSSAVNNLLGFSPLSPPTDVQDLHLLNAAFSALAPCMIERMKYEAMLLFANSPEGIQKLACASCWRWFNAIGETTTETGGAFKMSDVDRKLYTSADITLPLCKVRTTTRCELHIHRCLMSLMCYPVFT